MPTIDQATFEKLSNDVGADFVGELIATYCEETPQLIAKLRSALGANDVDTFRRAAHSIKSTSATFGALPLSETARELEMMGRAGDLAGAQEKVDRLVDESYRVQQALNDLTHD